MQPVDTNRPGFQPWAVALSAPRALPWAGIGARRWRLRPSAEVGLVLCEGLEEAVVEVDGLVEGGDAEALVAAVHALVDGVDGDAADAVAGDSGGHGVDAVGGSDFHLGEDGEAGVHLGDDLVEGAEDVGAQGWGRGRDALGAFVVEVAGVVFVLHGDGGVGEDFDELLTDLLLGVAGEDAAVDVGVGELREGVGSLAGGEHGGDAGGAEDGVEAWDVGEAGYGLWVGWGLEDGAHVGCLLAGFEGGQFFKVGSCDGVELEGELVLFEAGERVGDVVDGVVFDGEGAVAAGVLCGELEVAVELFSGFDDHDDGLAVLGVDAAGVGVDGYFGSDELGAVLEEPVDAVGLAALLVGGEGEDEVAVGDEALTLEADEVGDEDGVAVFHVLGAAAVEVAVLLDELEGVGGPLGLWCFDYVEVADDEDGLERGAGCGMVAGYQILLAGI